MKEPTLRLLLEGQHEGQRTTRWTLDNTGILVDDGMPLPLEVDPDSPGFWTGFALWPLPADVTRCRQLVPPRTLIMPGMWIWRRDEPGWQMASDTGTAWTLCTDNKTLVAVRCPLSEGDPFPAGSQTLRAYPPGHKGPFWTAGPLPRTPTRIYFVAAGYDDTGAALADGSYCRPYTTQRDAAARAVELGACVEVLHIFPNGVPYTVAFRFRDRNDQWVWHVGGDTEDFYDPELPEVANKPETHMGMAENWAQVRERTRQVKLMQLRETLQSLCQLAAVRAELARVRESYCVTQGRAESRHALLSDLETTLYGELSDLQASLPPVDPSTIAADTPPSPATAAPVAS